MNGLKKRGGLFVLLLAFALIVAACSSDSEETTTTEGEAAETTTTAAAAPSADIGLVYDIGGRGDQSFNDSAAAGLDQATAELGINPSEASANQDGSNREELLNLQADQSDLVFGVGFLFGDPMLAAATASPDVNFAIVDGFIADAPANIAMLGFAEEQGSFLVGAAAALKSTTGHLGFIGGVNM
ncbi:MAG: BMP family ABC transporter substrate-binding protein, partial [Actinomycetota bacterium]